MILLISIVPFALKAILFGTHLIYQKKNVKTIMMNENIEKIQDNIQDNIQDDCVQLIHFI